MYRGDYKKTVREAAGKNNVKDQKGFNKRLAVFDNNYPVLYNDFQIDVFF